MNNLKVKETMNEVLAVTLTEDPFHHQSHLLYHLCLTGDGMQWKVIQKREQGIL